MWRVTETIQSAAECNTLMNMFSTLMYAAGKTAIGELYILIGKSRIPLTHKLLP